MGRSPGDPMRRGRVRLVRSRLGQVRVLGALFATVLAAGSVMVGAVPAGARESRTGPGTIASAPALVVPSSTGNAVRLLFTAPAGGLQGGMIELVVPHGWSAPQVKSASRPGYVTSSAGALSVAHRRIRINSLDLCGGCSVAIGYVDARAPRGHRRSTFFTKSAAAAGDGLRPLAAQPEVTTTGRGAGALPLGDYAGFGNRGGIASFGHATGTRPSFATDFLDVNDGWNGMSSAAGLGVWRGSGYRLVLGVPIVPQGTGATLASGAWGANNSYFATLARNLVSEGLADTILRVGWEFNGDWFPWQVTNPADAANYAAYWRQIVTAMRSVRGERFQFLWNPISGGSFGAAYSPADAYPGNAYVDYVGTDDYDECWASPQTPQVCWSTYLAQAWGLDWLSSFAAAHGKPIAIPEWSVTVRSDGHGLGDDPYFVNQFAGWIASNDVAFTDVFAYDDVGSQDNDITDGSFPAALTAFRSDFGG